MELLGAVCWQCCGNLFQKPAHGILSLRQLSLEEMIGTLDPLQALGLGHFGEQGFYLGFRPKNIFGSLNNQLGLVRFPQETHILGGHRNSQAHQRTYARVRCAHGESHPRSEREADDADRNGGKPRLEVVDGRVDVTLFAFPTVVTSLAVSDPAKVEAKGRQAGLQGAFGRVKHHFVVQRASVEGMGMAHYRRESRRIVRVRFKQSLELAYRTVDEQSFEFRKTSSIPNICRDP